MSVVVADRERGALGMSRAHRIGNLIGVLLPIVGLVIAVVGLWDRFVGPADLAIASVLYVLTGLGISVGFHRLFTHRSFQTTPTIRAILAVLGSMSVQGSILQWVSEPLSFGEAWHNNHHAFPTSAMHGLRRREIDTGGWLIRGLARMGLAWDVELVDSKRQRARLER